MKLPAYPQKGKPVADSIRDIINYLRASTVTSVIGGRVKSSANGVTIEIIPNTKPGRSTGAASTCPFGEIVDVDDGTYTKAIRGGAMICGDQNFNVAYRGINLASAGSWLIEISLTGIDPATDDDDEIFLSGVITASGTPAWNSISYTGSENYTDTTNPSTPAGTGTIVIPIGILVVAGGAATFTPTGCGTITIGQCAGILSHTRG